MESYELDEDDESSSNTNLTPLTAPRSRNNMLLNIGDVHMFVQMQHKGHVQVLNAL